MLHEFLTTNRSDLIDRCRAKVAQRRAPRATPAELEHGIPLFLDQLAHMLRVEPAHMSHQGPSPGSVAANAEIQLHDSATMHGSELMHSDFTVEQVVHDYGDLCQSITELAVVQDAPITVEEFGTLNITLDNAIAAAVTEFSRQREISRLGGALAANEHLGELAHEMRNLLNTAILAIAAMKAGSVGFGGATAAALDRSLIGMSALIARTLAGVRLEAGEADSRELIELSEFILDVQVAAALEACSRGCKLTVLPVEAGLRVEADRHILASAIANLLQNACKFTRKDTHVLLRSYARKDRVFIEVEDECGGLPLGTHEALFRPFEQRGSDRTGLGLGLSLSRHGIEASGGRLYARDLPGRGCIFTIELPRKDRPPTVA